MKINGELEAMHHKNRFFSVVVLMSLLFTSTVQAYECSGNVYGVTLSPAGIVSAQNVGGFNWVYLCSISSTTNGVSVDACKSIYAMLLSAQATGKSVMFWFNDSGNCSSSAHPAWAWLTGWYWGPMLQ